MIYLIKIIIYLIKTLIYLINSLIIILLKKNYKLKRLKIKFNNLKKIVLI